MISINSFGLLISKLKLSIINSLFLKVHSFEKIISKFLYSLQIFWRSYVHAYCLYLSFFYYLTPLISLHDSIDPLKLSQLEGNFILILLNSFVFGLNWKVY